MDTDIEIKRIRFNFDQYHYFHPLNSTESGEFLYCQCEKTIVLLQSETDSKQALWVRTLNDDIRSNLLFVTLSEGFLGLVWFGKPPWPYLKHNWVGVPLEVYQYEWSTYLYETNDQPRPRGRKRKYATYWDIESSLAADEDLLALHDLMIS